MTETEEIENYPGVDVGIDGFTLGARMQSAAERFGAQVEQTEVLSVDLLSVPKRIVADVGERLGRTVIIATGATHRHLGIAHEEDLAGRGVAYCALCDGGFYVKKIIVAQSLNDAMDRVHALPTDSYKAVLLENDLPDNF